MEKYWFYYLLGYVYTFFLGGFFIRKIMRELNKSDVIGYSGFTVNEKATISWYGKVVGNIESLVYLTSLLIKKPEFIAAWLGFKVIGRWESAKLEAYHLESGAKNGLTKSDRIKNCANYNIFLIGTLLNIIFSATGWKIVIWLKHGRILIACIVGLLVVLLSDIFLRCAEKQSKRLEGV